MPHHIGRHIVLATIALTTLMGCSSKDDASASNFQNVLQTYYDEQAEPATCLARTIKEFPYTKPDVTWGFGNAEENLDALAADARRSADRTQHKARGRVGRAGLGGRLSNHTANHVSSHRKR